MVAIVVVTALLSVIFRNTAFVQRFTGKGYDTNPLPPQAFPRPEFAGAEYTIISQSVAISDGLPTNFWRTERDDVNLTSRMAKATIDMAKASIIGGTIGTPQSTSTPYEMIVDQQSRYEAGATPDDAWVRTPVAPGWAAVEILNGSAIRMYQDVIDPALRAQQPSSVVDETRREIPVTTYKYTFPFGDFYESAPRLFDLMQAMDGNADDGATVTVTISVDEQWLVRYLDVNVDYQSVLDHRAKHAAESRYQYRYTYELVSTTDAPPDVALPTKFVDAPVGQPTLATTVVVP